MYVPDPVGSKFVESLARPGGNATGLTNTSVELTGKRLQYLKEAVPRLSRVAFLINPNAKVSSLYVSEAKEASAKLGLTLQVYEARSIAELDRAFAAMAEAKMQALSINAEGLFFQLRAAIAKMALAHRLPTCVWSNETAEAGGMMAYGPDQVAIARRVAVYVDKILKGAKPYELPVEQPTVFDFVVNLKTAKSLGITIPQAILLQATKVIE